MEIKTDEEVTINIATPEHGTIHLGKQVLTAMDVIDGDFILKFTDNFKYDVLLDKSKVKPFTVEIFNGE